jgi:apolipoprotein N-acyltransferase
VTSRLLYELLLLLHAAAAVIALAAFFRAPTLRATASILLRLPEILVSLTAVFFLFTFIYATNANMDYVQRFMSSHGNHLLAPNSLQERLSAYARFLPLLLLDAGWYVVVRVFRPGSVRDALREERWPSTWALGLAIASGVLNGFAFPSFLRTAGLPVLGWVCLVPLMICLEEVPLRRGIWYGTLSGVLQTMISNYWLGTFNLFSLQFVTVVTAVEYLPFMAAALLVHRWAGPLKFLVLGAAWTGFDWVRSMGFLGYPWGMLGTSQYSVTPLIQAASLTGVWGITFLLVLANSVIAHYTRAAMFRERPRAAPGVVLGAGLAFCLAWAGVGAITDAGPSRGAPPRSVRLALVQQNADPRKDDYSATFDTLRRLTDEARAQKPDLVAWSETAFVPNIRRWSREDPKQYPLAALVRDFLAYQERMGTWLLTGNDDYDLCSVNGVEERLDYNGSVLFSARGERVETYHKIHLVPFTEYFPYKTQLPGIYALLMSFDANLWEPGDRRVVFRHPKFSFATPICFEDAFPDDVRRFAAAGAEVILNLSNDYWSLTEVEGMQHAANALFRAVENGRPLVRAAASGLTCVIDPRGRILARTPFYTESVLVADVSLSESRSTLYTRWGDWFPGAMTAALVLVLVGGILRRRRP